MSDTSDETYENPTDVKNIFRRPIWAIVGAIVIGIIGSGLYDLLVKPGISHFGDWFFKIISHSSVAIKNAPFSTAALDPTSLPSLIMLFLLGSVPISLLIILIPIKIIRDHIRKKNIKKSEKELKSTKLKALILYLFNIILLIIVSQTSVSIINKTILIDRIFHANLKICAPYITEKEEKILVSEFSSMETMDDYEKINKVLLEIATNNTLSLRKEKIE